MKLKELIYKSIYKDGEVSSSRIFSYCMMAVIFLFGFTAIGIELVNAIKKWGAGESYVIPTEHIVILGMWLAHQLTLLGIYKSAESKPLNKLLDKKSNADTTEELSEESSEESEV